MKLGLSNVLILTGALFLLNHASAQCSPDVTPPNAVCQDISPALSVTGNLSITPAMVDNGSTDNCSISTIAFLPSDQTDYDCFDLGSPVMVTLVVTDGAGNSTGCSATITVVDVDGPVPDVAVLPTDTGTCTTINITTTPTATDNCSGAIMGTTTDPLSYSAEGTYNITWYYYDADSNFTTQIETVILNGCASIEEDLHLSLNFYPNPGKGIFFISSPQPISGNMEVELTNNLGQMVYSGILQQQVQSFDWSYLQNSTYHLRVIRGDRTWSKTIVIEK